MKWVEATFNRQGPNQMMTTPAHPYPITVLVSRMPEKVGVPPGPPCILPLSTVLPLPASTLARCAQPGAACVC